MNRFITPVSLVLGLAVAAIPTVASAQFNGSFGSSDNRNPFSRAGSGDTSGLLNIINEAQLNSKNNPNYGAEQNARITEATEDYRTRQLQILRERNRKAAPATAPVVAPK
jgi:hypothetical protein